MPLLNLCKTVSAIMLCSKRAFLLILMIVIPTSSLTGQQDFSQLTPAEIVDQVDQMMRGDSSRGTIQMTVKTQRWSRALTLEIWSEGTEKVLVKVKKPKKEEGVASLKIDSDMWNYLPKIDRTIRVPTSMMMGFWMGSHFTNDDLVKRSRLTRDYDIEISYEGVKENVLVWEFVLTPRPDAPVVWGKIHYQVRKEDLMPTWAAYYGEDGQRKRTMNFSDYQEMGGRLVPAKIRMAPEDKPNEYTEITYINLEFDLAVDKSIFSLASLRRKR